jgi:MFS family permease
MAELLVTKSQETLLWMRSQGIRFAPMYSRQAFKHEGKFVFCGGLAADRIGAKRMIVFGLALQALSVSLYVFTRDLASFYGLALMFGFSYGAVMPLYAILVREYFGARIMGTMFGAVNMASTLGMAIGP